MQKLQQFKTWIITHRLIVGLAIVFLLIVILFFPQSDKVLQESTIPQATQAPALTGIKPLVLEKISPKEGSVALGDTQNSISLFFNVPVDPQTVRATVQPPITLEVKVLRDFPNRIILQPTTPWITGETYTITILKGARSSSNTNTSFGRHELEENIILIYTIKEVPPPYYPLGIEGGT